MRLICILNDEKQALKFSGFLAEEGIHNELEVIREADWENTDYGTATFQIWIIDEEDLEASEEWYQIFLNDPNDPRFSQRKPKATAKASTEVFSETIQKTKGSKMRMAISRPLAAGGIGPITLYLLIVCALLFIFGRLTAPPITEIPANLPLTPLYTAQINKKLMFDYPKAYEIIDKVVKAYGIEHVTNPEELPPVGKTLLNTYFHTPYWKGFYPIVVKNLKEPDDTWKIHAPLFEKISQGEVWRLFTPCLLHSDIFHLFFNMIWLLVLGKQMEERLGKLPFILFILITGILSNISQYMMSGSNFLGFSGILCAMIAFIWVRQKRAAWEGYSLQPATIGFIAIFVLVMFMISFASFLLQIYTGNSVGPAIANTAHLTGALIGYLLGRTEMFAVKKS